MSEGFVTLSRKYFFHHFWGETRSFSRAEAWLDLVQTAAFASGKRVISGNVVDIPRGGLVASVRWLSDRWKWSNTKVCLFLDCLEAEGMISREKRHGNTVVFLCKYEEYNSEKRRGNDNKATAGRQRDDEIEQGEEGKTPSASSQTAKPFWTKARGWENTDLLREEFSAAFPACNFDLQLANAALWLKANPTKATKSNWLRFLTNWFKRSQDRGGDQQSKIYGNNSSTGGKTGVGRTHDQSGSVARKY